MLIIATPNLNRITIYFTFISHAPRRKKCARGNFQIICVLEISKCFATKIEDVSQKKKTHLKINFASVLSQITTIQSVCSRKRKSDNEYFQIILLKKNKTES